ncbi:UDP-glucose,sterol transferase [Golovinomyces cichoracearum]|uniref:UDP-glucose,sterol transferase n=1 Tax=Golovinomyces cichoracearum TaxID=62708 RepID=A0A420HNX4_9PEZI|nr:UDP-glucose,sterol transferase [Golovinomyces cichoracearum]
MAASIPVTSKVDPPEDCTRKNFKKLKNERHESSLNHTRRPEMFRSLSKKSSSTMESPIRISSADHRRNIENFHHSKEVGLKDHDRVSNHNPYSTSDGNEEVPTCNKSRERVSNLDMFSESDPAGNNYQNKSKVLKKDGRLDIGAKEMKNSGYLAKAIGASFLKHKKPPAKSYGTRNINKDDPERSRIFFDTAFSSNTLPPTLNIVLMVIGSRGDIQPFLKIGKCLKDYGHRVRIATHPAFKKIVQEDMDLEFFSVGGDPAELMEFMVKNPGMIPTIETLKKGEVSRRRKQMAEMFEGFWRACINATDDEKDHANLKMMTARAPFIADAIIANPPSFAHIHCAEKLGIPLHLMFTFPYTPTQEFAHPLANVNNSSLDTRYINFMSYPLVEMMTWQGLGDLINKFRVKTLGLEPISTLWAPGQLYRLKVPHTYLWSPSFVPKPGDWGPEIDIAGFVFLDLASSFEPCKDLLDFLDKGSPPIYIGFGSIIVEDPDGFTKMIFDAVRIAGVRALVSKGWGNLGGDETPDNIFLLDNVPHDWLFPRVSAVVHHGGAGTTAAGMKFGKPTFIVPFFGDQLFWGNMVGKSGAGASPILNKSLTAQLLADGIRKCLSSEARESARKIAENIKTEGDGAVNALRSFHRNLNLRGLNSIRCSILENRIAVWKIKKTKIRLCALAAELLIKEKKLNRKQLELIRHNEWNDFEGPGEPLTGGASAVLGSMTGVASGIGSIPVKIGKTTKRRVKCDMKKWKEYKLISQNRLSVDKVKRDQKEIGGNRKKKNNLFQLSFRFRDGMNKNGGGDRIINTSKNDQTHSCPNKIKISSDDAEDNPVTEVIQAFGSGIGKSAGALVKSPMNLSLAIAQGLHNAPRLYGDRTVRRPFRVTGLISGLKAAGHEFVFGIYDGFSGLVIQPYNGARDGGAVGFIKGIGMGLTGFVLKDLSAIISPIGYTLKGIQKEISVYKSPIKFIRTARIIEGQRDLDSLSKEEAEKNLEDVLHGWYILEQISTFMVKKHSSELRDKICLHRERKTWKANVYFENIRFAEKALEALKRGENLSDVLLAQEEELD